MQNLIAVSEILCALLADKSGPELKFGGKDFLTSTLNVSIAPNLSIIVVENSNDSINLILPYYCGLEERSAASGTDDADLCLVSGGADSLVHISKTYYQADSPMVSLMSGFKRAYDGHHNKTQNKNRHRH